MRERRTKCDNSLTPQLNKENVLRNGSEKQKLGWKVALNLKGFHAVKAGRGLDWNWVKKGSNQRGGKKVKGSLVGLRIPCMELQRERILCMGGKRALVRG